MIDNSKWKLSPQEELETVEVEIYGDDWDGVLPMQYEGFKKAEAKEFSVSKEQIEQLAEVPVHISQNSFEEAEREFDAFNEESVNLVTCSVCQGEFVPTNPIETVCSITCMLKINQ